jgi:uncharacterized membrane protein
MAKNRNRKGRKAVQATPVARRESAANESHASGNGVNESGTETVNFSAAASDGSGEDGNAPVSFSPEQISALEQINPGSASRLVEMHELYTRQRLKQLDQWTQATVNTENVRGKAEMGRMWLEWAVCAGNLLLSGIILISADTAAGYTSGTVVLLASMAWVAWLRSRSVRPE